MRLKANKTWSQQQLALKLRVEESGLLSWEHQRLLILAAKTALAATLCWWLAQWFGLHDGYFLGSSPGTIFSLSLPPSSFAVCSASAAALALPA